MSAELLLGSIKALSLLADGYPPVLNVVASANVIHVVIGLLQQEGTVLTLTPAGSQVGCELKSKVKQCVKGLHVFKLIQALCQLGKPKTLTSAACQILQADYQLVMTYEQSDWLLALLQMLELCDYAAVQRPDMMCAGFRCAWRPWLASCVATPQ